MRSTAQRLPSVAAFGNNVYHLSNSHTTSQLSHVFVCPSAFTHTYESSHSIKLCTKCAMHGTSCSSTKKRLTANNTYTFRSPGITRLCPNPRVGGGLALRDTSQITHTTNSGLKARNKPTIETAYSPSCHDIKTQHCCCTACMRNETYNFKEPHTYHTYVAYFSHWINPGRSSLNPYPTISAKDSLLPLGGGLALQ